MLDVQFGQPGRLRIVGAPNQDNVSKGHPDQERHDACQHYFIFAEQTLRADIAADNSNEDDDQGKASTPPARQQRRIVLEFSPRIGRDVLVQPASCQQREERRH